VGLRYVRPSNGDAASATPIVVCSGQMTWTAPCTRSISSYVCLCENTRQFSSGCGRRSTTPRLIGKSRAFGDAVIGRHTVSRYRVRCNLRRSAFLTQGAAAMADASAGDAKHVLTTRPPEPPACSRSRAANAPNSRSHPPGTPHKGRRVPHRNSLFGQRRQRRRSLHSRTSAPRR
jgi:hypothetical protein